jgi:hypothetical protein
MADRVFQFAPPVGAPHSLHVPHQVAIPIEYRWASLVTKPFEPNEMKEALADMLGLPEDWPPPEDLRSDVRH